MPNIGYLWGEPNTKAEQFVWKLSRGTLSAEQKAEFEKWAGSKLADNPGQNALLAMQYAKDSLKLGDAGRQLHDEFGRPLTFGRTGTIRYTGGDPNDPSTWKGEASAPGVADTKVSVDPKTGAVTVSGTSDTMDLDANGNPVKVGTHEYNATQPSKWTEFQSYGKATGTPSTTPTNTGTGLGGIPGKYAPKQETGTKPGAAGGSSGRLAGPRGMSLADYMNSQPPPGAPPGTPPGAPPPPAALTPIPGVTLPQDMSWANRVMRAGGIQNNMGLNSVLSPGAPPPGPPPAQPTPPPDVPTTATGPPPGFPQPPPRPGGPEVPYGLPGQPPPGTKPSTGTTPRLSLNQVLSGGQASELVPPGAPSPLGQQMGGK